MNYTRFFLFALLLVATPFCTRAQYKYDVGLKVSSNHLERFQLEGRFHFRTPYSLMISVNGGSEIASNNIKIPVYSDSLYSYSNSRTERSNISIKTGIQRKLKFPSTDIFYVGSSLGIGFLNRYELRSTGSYIIDSVVNYPPQTYIQEIDFTETYYSNRSIRTELAFSFGLNAPFSERLSINAEIGLSTYIQSSLTNNESTFFNQFVYASGGLRYSFGKRLKVSPANLR